MTQPLNRSESSTDPDGSIFLPKTNFPEREFESWQFQLLTGRGIAAQKDYDEIQQMSVELSEARRRYIGGEALKAL